MANDIRSVDINGLLTLAGDRSQSARKALMDNVVDFFLNDANRLNEHERALMGDILAKLVGKVEADVRRNLAETLIRRGIDLPDLHTLLANDDIEIARPILEKSRLLRDIDLIEIVKARTDEHRLAIAIRDKVSAEVGDALVDHGSPDVLEALIRNEDATLSRRAMEYLVAESRRVDRFQEPLVGRSDLPSDLAYKMYWWVSAALRHKVLRTFPIDDSVFDAAVQEASHMAIAEMDDAQSAQGRAQRLARRMMETRELTDLFLLNTLRQQRITLFVAGLAERGAISFKSALRVVMDKGFESFIVLARAIEMNRDTMTSIILLLADVRNPEAARRPEVLTAILKLYDSLDLKRARRIMALWQRDIAYQEAVDELQSSSAA